MTRIKGIIAAGTLTGLIVITIFALGFRNANAAQSTQTNPTDTTTIVTTAPDQTTQDMQAYTAELETALQTMQARELQYRQQIDTANQTIQQLQTQNTAPAPRSFFAEHEEHEHGHDD